MDLFRYEELNDCLGDGGNCVSLTRVDSGEILSRFTPWRRNSFLRR